MQKQVKRISFKEQNIYVGIDVHIKSWTITVIVGEVVYKSFSQDPCAKTLKKYLHKNFPDGKYFSVYEAGFCGFSVHRELTEEGICNIVVNPADIPTSDKERRQKEDRRDSRKLARGIRSQELEGIYILSPEFEGLRSLVRYRKTLTKELCRQKNRIKSFLNLQGIKIPTELNIASKYWSGIFIKWLKTIDLHTVHGTTVLNDTIETAEFLRKKLLKVNREFRAIDKNSEYSKMITLLRHIPGIGLIVALTLISELETINRFKS